MAGLFTVVAKWCYLVVTLGEAQVRLSVVVHKTGATNMT